MKDYCIYMKPEKGEPYRFVTGFRRRWLLRGKLRYSYLPTVVRANDYKELLRLQMMASQDTGREVVVTEDDEMYTLHRDNMFWAVRPVKPIMDGEWYTGKWYADKLRKSTGAADDGRRPETSADIRDCQLFVRDSYAYETSLQLNRKGFASTVAAVFVNVENVFARPSIVTLCVNKRAGGVRYLKSYRDDDRRLRYTNNLADAMMIYPEQMDSVYEHLSSQHKDLSFTMIVRPRANLAASEVKKHEAELVQRMAVDFYIGKNKTKKE